MARSKKCSRGKKAVRSHKRSSGKKVKSYCRKVSRKMSQKRSRKMSQKRSRKSPMCPPGLVWRKSHKRSSGKRVKGQCVRSPLRHTKMMSSRPFIASSLLSRTPVASAPSLEQIEGAKTEMPALESVKGEYGFGSCGYGFEYF